MCDRHRAARRIGHTRTRPVGLDRHPMTRVDPLARALATWFLAAPDWTPDGLVAIVASTLARRPRWARPLAKAAIALFPEPPHAHVQQLAAAIAAAPAFARAKADPEQATSDRPDHGGVDGEGPVGHQDHSDVG